MQTRKKILLSALAGRFPPRLCRVVFVQAPLRVPRFLLLFARFPIRVLPSVTLRVGRHALHCANWSTSDRLSHTRSPCCSPSLPSSFPRTKTLPIRTPPLPPHTRSLFLFLQLTTWRRNSRCAPRAHQAGPQRPTRRRSRCSRPPRAAPCPPACAGSAQPPPDRRGHMQRTR